MNTTAVIPEFHQTKAGDFEILTDSIDTRLSIIKHKATGYFNITKVAALIHSMKEQDGTATMRPKIINDWMRLDRTKRLIACCVKRTGIDKVRYTLREGTPEDFMGIYIHELMYSQFMQWLDEDYALDVSFMLKRHREEYNRRLQQTIRTMADEEARLNDIIQGYDQEVDAHDPDQDCQDESDESDYSDQDGW